MSDNEHTRASWLVPAVVAAIVALLTSMVSATLQHLKDSAEDRREVVRIRSDILKAAGDSKSLVVASVLLDHVLKPIDGTEDRAEFTHKVQDYIATLATETANGSASRQELAHVVPDAVGDEASLIAKFTGAERLSASNALIERAQTAKAGVIDALIAGIRPAEDKFAYRVNLYVVFTLGRLPGGWSGTAAQVARVRQLSIFDNDPTFKARLGEALAALAKPPA